jgi:polyferredoxin
MPRAEEPIKEGTIMPASAAFKGIGFLYALVMIFVLGYLWYSGKWKQKFGIILLVISALLGFLIFSPVAPYQFQQLVLRDELGLGAPLIVGIIGLLTVFLLTFIFGRFFCGYLCPVGAVQELAYLVPVPKGMPRKKILFQVIRGFMFLVFLVMAFAWSASLLEWFGIHDFFRLLVTAGSLVFVVVLVLSLAFYRPFCRLVCPYGLLLSLGAIPGVLRLRRTDACIECKKCEKVCPTDEAKRQDAKAECYLCGRCTEVCPKEGALKYMRK